MNDNDNETVSVTNVSELPLEVQRTVMRDAEVFKRMHAGRGTKWLCETMALFKYQVEGAHERLDELKELVQHLMRALHEDLPSLDEDDDSNPWSRGDNWWRDQ